MVTPAVFPLTVSGPLDAPNVMEGLERVALPAAVKLTNELLMKLRVVPLRVMAPAVPGAETANEPVRVLEMLPLMATFPWVAAAEKAPLELSVRAPIVIALDTGALEEVIERLPVPDVAKAAVIEKSPSAAWPARKVPVPADWV